MECRTKIIATLGPSTNTQEIIEELIVAGMDVARLNFSHGSIEDHRRVIKNIHLASKKTGRDIGILLDLQGPKIRIGKIEDKKISLEEGQPFVITTRDVPGDNKEVSTNYEGLPKDLNRGARILLDDGLLELEVQNTTEKDIYCTVIRGGELSEKKGINLPGAALSLPSLTDKDREDLATGIKEGVDFIAISFIRTSEDVQVVKNILEHEGASIPVIAKIEKPEAVENLEAILKVADGIMVARGDLGVEMLPEQVPIIQKEIIRRCNEEGTPVITATQMLESMIHHPTPTRAEASDVANAIVDGTDAVMLSGETAVGKYPVEAVNMMSRIAHATEDKLLGIIKPDPDRIKVKGDPEHAIAHAVYYTAMDIDAKAIVTFTRSGGTACIISKYRPNIPIIAITHTAPILKRLSLYWGVKGVHVELKENTDAMIDNVEKKLLEAALVKRGDKIIITLGVPWGVVGSTNMLMIHHIG
ncbi:MAG TPA: pyruvate kinase [Nitrospiraceae bacterium]|nr:pyruvate kinase [Nitrospiraceae bacterium]